MFLKGVLNNYILCVSNYSTWLEHLIFWGYTILCIDSLYDANLS